MPRSATTLLALLVLGLILAACGAPPAALTPTPQPPTETPRPTFTATTAPTETATITPTVTQTPRPVMSATPKAENGLYLLTAGRYDVLEGGYSVSRLKELAIVPQSAGRIMMVDPEGRVMLILIGEPNPEGATKEQMLEAMFYGLRETSPQMKRSLSFEIELGEIDGLAVDLNGTLEGEPVTGRLAVALPGFNQRFSLLAMSIGKDADLWKNAGEPVFNTVAQSLQFFSLEASTGGCPTSTDATYGFSQDNPIQVGGDYIHGPVRELEFLSVLRGPGGEPVMYEFIESEEYGDTTLDVFQLQHSGMSAPLTIYIDKYVYHEPIAPKGFTCAETVPFKAPEM